MKGKNIFPGASYIKAGGKVIFCDEDGFTKEPYLLGPRRPIQLRVPGGQCRSIRLYEPGVYKVHDALHPRVRGTLTVVP
jgi:hypothetical protein